MKIGITISGGGYRATSFGLGSLSYFNHLKYEDVSLLKKVIALSTVSGGSITGITYAQWTKAGLPFEDYFKWLFEQVTEFDLVKTAIDNYSKDSTKNSLIEGFASTYGNNLLTHSKFWSILPNLKEDGILDTHLLYYSINATDFNTGTPFRFIAQHPNWQKYKIDKVSEEGKNKGMRPFNIGNGFFNIDKNIPNLPLNVALAASSCFPGGFEPIILRMKEHLNKVNSLHDTVGLMDGGIVDNQGIDALCDFHAKVPLDLVLIVDSASPNITKYEQSKLPNIPIIGNSPLQKLFMNTCLLNAISILALIISLFYSPILTFIFTIVATFLSIATLSLVIGKKKLNKILEQKHIDSASFQPLGSLTPNNIVQLFKNRITSLESLVGTVFMKHLRRMNSNNIFRIENLNGRIMFNTLYQMKVLTENELFLKLNNSQKGSYGLNIKSVLANNPALEQLKETNYTAYYEQIRVLLNSPEYFNDIPNISERAFGMGTTLWVEKNEQGKAQVRDVIVTGQINSCLNILNNAFIKEKYSEIYKQAEQDWKRFIEAPYWLFDQLMSNTNNVHGIFKNQQNQQKANYQANIVPKIIK